MPIVTNNDFAAGGFKNFVRKFGRVESIGSEAICWDGGDGYDGWLENEEDIEWRSSSAADVPGGTGCNYIQFTGQGEDGIEKTYSGQINGASWTRLSDTDDGVKFNTIYTATCLNTEGMAGNASMSPMLSGGSANIGTITIRSVTTQNIMAIITPNYGRTQMMIWRCPKDHYAEFNKISIYPTSGKPLVARLMARDSLDVSWLCVGAIDFDGNLVSITHPFPDYISPGTDLCLVIIPEQTGTNCSAQMWIEKKPIPNYQRLLEEGDI